MLEWKRENGEHHASEEERERTCASRTEKRMNISEASRRTGNCWHEKSEAGELERIDAGRGGHVAGWTRVER